MEINFPNLVNAALPERDKKGRNAIILSNNMGPNHNEQGFLSRNFPRSPPKLYITAESDDFDEHTLHAWRAEGFRVEYLSMGDSTAEYKAKLASLTSQANLGPCETYGIVAYGDAAGTCLEYFHVMDNNPEFKLGCLVAYYPTQIPDTRAQFPSAVQVLVHLAGKEVDVVSHSQIVGIQGKRRITKRKVERGLGAGGLNTLAYPCYTYDAEPGFAEHDLDEYDKISAELAWSRSLAAVRRAFRMDVDHEKVVEQNVESKFYTRNLGQTMSTYTTHKSPHVTYFPTLTGGIGVQELQRFYSDYFLNANPPSTKLTLLSRTIGGDRVVDELHIAFKHTQEMPWILPGVPPTNKRVEVVIVSIVTLRGGKLCHEHVYWDQASVLMQVGLLDPKLIPDKARLKGVAELPVVGREAARRLIRGFDDEEDGEADNELIPGWYNDDDNDYDDEPQPEEKKVGQTGKGNRKDVETPTQREPEQSKEKKRPKGSNPSTGAANSEEHGILTSQEREELQVKGQKEKNKPKPSTQNGNSKELENPTRKQPEQSEALANQKNPEPAKHNTNTEDVGSPTAKGAEEPKEPRSQKKKKEESPKPPTQTADSSEDGKPVAKVPEEPREENEQLKPEETKESQSPTANRGGQETETEFPEQAEVPKEHGGAEPSTTDTCSSKETENTAPKGPEDAEEQKESELSAQPENGYGRNHEDKGELPAGANGLPSEENPNGEG